MQLTPEMEAECRKLAKIPSNYYALIYPTGDDEVVWDILPARKYSDAQELTGEVTPPGYKPSDCLIVNLLKYWEG